MKYELSCEQASTHYLNIQFKAKVKGLEQIQIQLPSWRPGRYELGNFAKNIQKWNAVDEKGNRLISRKKTKDLWEVDCKPRFVDMRSVESFPIIGAFPSNYV